MEVRGSGVVEFLVAPSERDPIAKLGKSAKWIEPSFGVDIFWGGTNGGCGVQRKATMDLIASVRGKGGDRLIDELKLMRNLSFACVVIEGTPAWTSDGKLATEHTSWSLRQQWSVESTIQEHGAFVYHTRNALETCSLVEYLYERTNKPDHLSSLLNRGGPQANGWGQVTDEEYAVHLMTGYRGVGVELARRLYEAFGRVPCRHDLSLDSLLKIDGIGRKKAESIMKVMG